MDQHLQRRVKLVNFGICNPLARVDGTLENIERARGGFSERDGLVGAGLPRQILLLLIVRRRAKGVISTTRGGVKRFRALQ